MHSDLAKEKLLHAFRSHHITMSEDRVQAAFDSTELSPEMIEEYLQPETLLSFEEAEL